MTGRTYRYFTGQPLWPFGFGLSYATFRHSRPHFEGGQVRMQVWNDSPRDGDEVVQIYKSPKGKQPRALRELQAFRRIHLRSGENQEILLRLADPHTR